MTDLQLPLHWECLTANESFSQISTTHKKVKTKDCQPEGRYPVIDQGQDSTAGYVDDEEKVISVDRPVCIFGDHTRAVKWIDHDFVPGADGTKVLSPKEFLDPRFAYYQLRATSLPDKGYSRHFKYLKEAPFLVPPLAEQTRIANKLDELLAQVDTIKARVDAIPDILKRFRQSVLAAAVSGRLTEEWRVANPSKTSSEMLKGFEVLPRPARYKTRSTALIHGVIATAVGKPVDKVTPSWDWVPLVDIARMESGHTPSRSKPEYWNGDVEWIGIKDARSNHASTIYSTEQSTNELGLSNSAARLLPENTVCISRTASVGYVVKMGKRMATSQDFVNWVPSEVVNPDWLKWLFVAEKESLFRFGKGSTHTTVYFPEWLSMHVALPHIEEQSVIVSRIEELFAFAELIEQRLVEAAENTNGLTQSILAKAFRGELVPQNPDDEPASDLLERIQGE